MPTKADPITKERSYKQGAVGAGGAGGMEVILAQCGAGLALCLFSDLKG